jgi:hypothetical protein
MPNAKQRSVKLKPKFIQKSGQNNLSINLPAMKDIPSLHYGDYTCANNKSRQI